MSEGGALSAAESLLSKLGGAAKDLYHRIAGERYSDGIVIRGPKEYRDKVRKRLDELQKTPSGKEIVKQLDEQGRNGKGVEITLGSPGLNRCIRTGKSANAFPEGSVDLKTGRVVVTKAGRGTSSRVEFDPDYEPTYSDGTSCRSPAVGLGHELLHAIHNGKGTNLAKFPDDTDPLFPPGKPSNHEEAHTIGRGAYYGDWPTDNSLRKEMGYKERNSHGSVCP